MTVITFPDTEGALRSWLREQEQLTDLVAKRIFLGVPTNATFPLISIQQVGGGPQAGEAPVEDALIQFDCWAYGREGHWNKVQLAEVKNVLTGLLQAMNNVALDSSTTGYGAKVLSVVATTDQPDGRPRYIVTAQVTARTN